MTDWVELAKSHAEEPANITVVEVAELEAHAAFMEKQNEGLQDLIAAQAEKDYAQNSEIFGLREEIKLLKSPSSHLVEAVAAGILLALGQPASKPGEPRTATQ